MVEVKSAKTREILPIVKTENKSRQPLLGLARQDKLEVGLQGNKNTNIIRNMNTDERCEN